MTMLEKGFVKLHLPKELPWGGIIKWIDKYTVKVRIDNSLVESDIHGYYLNDIVTCKKIPNSNLWSPEEYYPF